MKILALVSLSVVSIAGFSAELVSRAYTFKTTSATLTCTAGIPPNGHNYPTPTRIAMATSYGASSILYASKLPLNNTRSVELLDASAQPCSAFADLLQVSGYMDGQATQTFSAHLGRPPGDPTECFRFEREDLTITVKGHELKGSADMTHPMDPADCP
jgi:hypothetical protein